MTKSTFLCKSRRLNANKKGGLKMTWRQHYINIIQHFCPVSMIHCDRYANAVMNLLQTRLPIGGTSVASAIYNNLAARTDRNWHEITWQAAVVQANAGIPTVAVSPTNPNGRIAPPHIAIVRPTNANVQMLSQMRLAQSGRVPGHYVTMNDAWRETDRNTIRFYTFIGPLPQLPQPTSMHCIHNCNVYASNFENCAQERCLCCGMYYLEKPKCNVYCNVNGFHSQQQKHYPCYSYPSRHANCMNQHNYCHFTQHQCSTPFENLPNEISPFSVNPDDEGLGSNPV